MMMKSMRCFCKVMVVMACFFVSSTAIVFGKDKISKEDAARFLESAYQYFERNDFKSIVGLIPSDMDVWPDYGTAYEAMWILLSANMVLEDYAAALDAAEKIVYIYPHDENVYAYKAGLDFHAHNYEEVVRDATIALGINDHDYVAYNTRGMAFIMLGQIEKAVDDFSHAILAGTLVGEVDDADYVNRAFVYGLLHVYDKAFDDCMTALTINPRNGDALWTRGILYANDGLYQKAADDAGALIEILGEKDVRGYLLRGYAYHWMEEYKKSIEDLSFLISHDKKNILAYLLRGCAYMHTGKNKSALKDLKQALKLSPDAYQCHEALGVFYLRQNEKAKARGYFEKAIELSPEHSQVSQNVLDTMDSIDAETAKKLFPNMTIPIENWGIFNLDSYRALMGGGL